jgi:hypothetical protein
MYIFVDESGTTDEKNFQGFLVVAFALSANRAFAEQLILSIKDRCKVKGKPINNKELKYHDLTPFQREIAIKGINSDYKNFYLCFFEINSARKEVVTGEYEEEIQSESIRLLFSKLDKKELKTQLPIKVIMDKKLSDKAIRTLKSSFQQRLGSKKGLSIETCSSSKERGVQLADLIAGAFRAKLMKKSDLFEVDQTKVFQISIDLVD